MAFNWKVSWVALGLIIVTAIAAAIVARKRRELQGLWWMLVALGVASVVLMLSSSAWLWRVLPELRFMQFPWRWLDVLSLVFAFFVAAAMSRAPKERGSWVVIGVVFLGIGATAAAIIRDADWSGGDFVTLVSAVDSGRGYQGTYEYAPVGCDPDQFPGNPDDTERVPDVSSVPAPRVAKLDPDSGDIVPAAGVRVHVEQWTAERKAFTADTAVSVTLALRLVDYPDWNVRLDRQEIRAELRPDSKQILLPLQAAHIAWTCVSDAHGTALLGMRSLLLPRLHFLRSGGPCGGRLRKRAVLELLLALAVLAYRVAAAVELEFVCRQTFEPHGTAGVELLVLIPSSAPKP